jgi:phospholipid/cholesterol/gamma-HCH transport system substrate-binding protein
MGPRRPNFELKVGIFVVIGLLVLTSIIFRIEGFKLFKPGYTIHIIFNYVSGLDVGAPVNLSGVEVGEVKDMRIFYNEELEKTQVDITAWIRGETIVRETSIAKIKTLGLLGEKCIELSPAAITDKALEEGGALFGQDPISLEDLAEVVNTVAGDLEETIRSINSVISDPAVRQALRDSITNFEQASRRANSILVKIDENKGTVGRLISEDKIYRDLEELVDELKRNPWKLLHKTKEKKKEDETKEKKEKKKQPKRNWQ